MDPSDPAGEATTEFCDTVSEDHFRAVSKKTVKKHGDQSCRKHRHYGSNVEEKEVKMVGSCVKNGHRANS